jgi:hypothetical protein
LHKRLTVLATGARLSNLYGRMHDYAETHATLAE